jgi:hypothetical protein
MLLTNEGYLKEDFKAALGVIRLFESSATAMAYFYLGFFTIESLAMAQVIIPSVIIGMPLGSYFIGKLNAESFRRICISIDSWLIAFGLYKVLGLSNLVPTWLLGALPLVIVLVDFVTALRFFRHTQTVQAVEEYKANTREVSEIKAA